jgi:5-methylcytosine-specific restriction endonuclease McrA
MTESIPDKVQKLREYYREYRKKNREKINASSKKYYESHKEEHLERTQNWKDNNKEKVAARRKELYHKDPEKYRAAAKKRYTENRESAIESVKRYIKRNLEAVAERKKKWYENNKDKNREYSHKRRATVWNVEGGHFTDAEFRELCEKYGNKCLRCGQTGVKLTADHVIPISLGIAHTDEISNIQPLCLSCNSKKHTKTVDYRP